jgi:hypothetical protein
MSRVMGNAGLKETGGSYRLRHTVILRQLKANQPKRADEVAQWVGIRDVTKMIERYRSILFDPSVEVV